MNSTINLVVSVDDHYVEHLEDLLISIWNCNSTYYQMIEKLEPNFTIDDILKK